MTHPTRFETVITCPDGYKITVSAEERACRYIDELVRKAALYDNYAQVDWPTGRAAIRTLQGLKYSYAYPAEQWKPPLGPVPAQYDPGLDIPKHVYMAAAVVSDWFAERNIKSWSLDGIKSNS